MFRKTIACAALVASSAAVNAAVLTNTNTSYIASLPALGGDVLISNHVTGGDPRGIRGGRVNGQTFTLAAPGTIDKIYLEYGALTGTNRSFTFRFFSLAGDANTTPYVESTLYDTGSFSTPADLTGIPAAGVLVIDVTNIALPAGSYGFSFNSSSASSGTDPFNIQESYGSTYAGGFYAEGGNRRLTSGSLQQGDLGFGVAMAPVPEPATLGLLAAGSLLLMHRRRSHH